MIVRQSENERNKIGVNFSQHKVTTSINCVIELKITVWMCANLKFKFIVWFIYKWHWTFDLF